MNWNFVERVSTRPGGKQRRFAGVFRWALIVVAIIAGGCQREKRISDQREPAPTPAGVPRGATWKYVDYVSEPPGARIEVNGNYVGVAPCRGVIWVSGTGSANLTITGYSPDGLGYPQSKFLIVPPIPDRVYFDMRPMVRRAPTPVQSEASKAADRAALEQAAARQSDARRSQQATQYRTTRRTAPPPDYSFTSTAHWIDEVLEDGKFILLEDGSLWEVDDVDTVTSSIWLPASEVLIIDNDAGGMGSYRLLNKDDGDSVAAEPREYNR